MCISTTAPAPSKLSVMEYSQSVNFVETGILIPFPSERGKAWVDTTVFQNKVNRFDAFSINVLQIVRMFADVDCIGRIVLFHDWCYLARQ